MNILDWREWIGIVATLFVFLGFTRSKAIQIRIINSIGSILFVVYGVLIGAFSVWLLNGACLLLNIYKVIQDIKDPPVIERRVVSSDSRSDIQSVLIVSDKNISKNSKKNSKNY